MTITDMPPLNPELEALLAAERPLPSLPPGVQERLGARIASTLGWTGTGPAGGGGAGGIGAARLALAVIALAGLSALGYHLLHRGRSSAGSNTPARASTSAASQVPQPDTPPELPIWFGHPDRPARRIAGRVLHDARPVAGARVVLMSDAARAGLYKAPEVMTGADGAFDFGPQRAAEYDVSAITADHRFGYTNVASHDPVAEPQPEQLTINLPACDHVLHGTVSDASGGPIAGAEVLPAWNSWGWSYPRGAGVATDASGHYELCIGAGRFTALVRAEGYGTLAIQETVIGRRRRDVDLVPEAVILGRVIDVANGQPVAGAQVRVWPPWSSPPPARVQSSNAITVTDADGRFRIVGMAPGRHTVFAASIGLRAIEQVVVEAGQESAELVLRAGPNALVHGTVVEAGHPVPGARVRPVIGNFGRGGWRIADAQGGFELWEDVDPGPIGFEVEGYRVLTPERHDARPPGEPRSPVVIEVVQLGTIRGRVMRGDQPVPGADVEATGSSSTIERADQEGRFVLRGLPAGRYRVTARSETLRAAASTGGVAVELATGEDRSGVDIGLEAAASIAGRVVDADGHSVAGVRVEYRRTDGGDSCAADTGETGEFLCDVLAGGGRYVPAVRADAASGLRLPSLEGDELPGVQVADGSTRVTGQLLRVRADRARLVGRVLDDSGEPVADATVRAIDATTGYSVASAPWAGIRTALSAADGSFILEVWTAGRYILHARAANGAEGSVEDVHAGKGPVVVRVAAVGAVRGKLDGFAASPDILIRRIGNTVDFWRVRLDGQLFSATGLAPGRYAVLAIAGYQGAGEEIEIVAGRTTTLLLRPRATARVTGTVTDFVTGRPAPGVRCMAAPYVRGAGIYLWGTPFAPASDEQGRFVLTVPSGSIEVTCERDGATKLTVPPGDEVAVAIPVVVSAAPPDAVGNGIGAQFIFSHRDPRPGYVHTIGKLRPGGAAERAGLATGDIVVSIDNRDVTVLPNIRTLLGTYPLGATVTIGAIRSGTVRSVRVTIEAAWQ